LNVELVDIGSNLTHDSFAADRTTVIAQAFAAGITRQVVTGADLASSVAAAAIAATQPSQLWSTAGVHPHHASTFDSVARERITLLLQDPHVVAVGECGLDYFRNFSPAAAQRAAFIAQLEIGMSTGKPVFLHQRDAHEDFKAILRDCEGALRHGQLRGVAHCFTGDMAQLTDYLTLGLSIGITGWVCDERRGTHLREVVAAIPADRLMLETDAPYLLPRDLEPRPKSRRNEPKFLTHIARTVAALRNETLQQVAAVTTRNAIEFFGLT
jgi:TatD DNase family protein